MTIYNDITENIIKDEYHVTSYVLDINHEANCYIFINKDEHHSTPYLRAVQIMYEIRGIDIVEDDRFNEMPTYIGPDTNNKYHLKDWEDKPDIKHVYTIRYNNIHNTYEFEQVKGMGVVGPIIRNVNDPNEFVELIFDDLELIVQEHEIEEKRKDRINNYKNRINSLNEDERKRLVSAILKNISKRKEE